LWEKVRAEVVRPKFALVLSAEPDLFWLMSISQETAAVAVSLAGGPDETNLLQQAVGGANQHRVNEGEFLRLRHCSTEQYLHMVSQDWVICAPAAFSDFISQELQSF
jgi:hypothetical protein